MATERLQKLIAAAGVTSRRKAEDLIIAGRVTVNGEVVENTGVRADPQRDDIRLDGRPLPRPRTIHLALHKPVGVTSSVSDPHADRVVTDLLGDDVTERVYPAGRLDRDSEGLMILTNDGELMHAITRPASGVDKLYEVVVRGAPDVGAIRQLSEGAEIAGRKLLPCTIDLLGAEGPGRRYRVILSEGKKNQIRRMFASIGHPVVRLVRLRIGPVELGDLQQGAYRPLTATELDRLRGAAGLENEGGTTMKRSLRVAIDGPSGAGKSTLARALARELGLAYVDTGAMYRAVAWAALQRDAGTAEEVESLLPDLRMEVAADPEGFHVLVDGRELSAELRDPAVGKRASQIAQIPSVRAWLVERQRAEARDGAVLEGRDIGTVVLPDADVKLFVTAPEEVRMERRAQQLGTAMDARISEDIRDRDRRDSQRSASPLRAAEDAVVIDTGGETPEDSLRRMLETVAAALEAR